MLAWRVREFGSPEVMQLEQVPTPEPGAGEVLVKVAAAGVGPWDGWVRSGRSALPQPLPLTLGSDLSGEIVGVGPGVTGLGAGEQVYGVTNPRFVGAYAQFAVASATMVSRKPASITFVEAASAPVIAVTAWQALFDQAHLQAGQTVVIHGAAGNVGAYAVQLARRAELRTIATAFGEDLPLVRELGADLAIDVKAQRFEELVRDADAVIDLVGGEIQQRSFRVLRPGGRLVSTVSHPDQELARRHRVQAAFFLVNVTSGHLAQLSRYLEQGELRVRVGIVLPFAQAREAHLMLERLRPAPKGKIVLDLSI